MKKLIFLAVLLLFSLPGKHVYGETLYKNYPLDRRINLQGVFTGDRFYFTTENYWNVKAAQLNLVFTQSDLLNSNESTLTVYLNGNPEYSMRLAGKTKFKENLTINLHTVNLKEGINEIRLQGYRRITDKPCTDDVNQANWLTFYEESFVRLDFEEKKAENIIGSFPYPFLKAGNGLASTVIIIPDNYNSKELQAALLLSSYLGAERRQEDINVTLAKFSDFAARKPSDPAARNTSDIIFIGSPETTPKELLQLFNPEELANASSTAVMKIADSPYNKARRSMCILSGTGSESLDTAVRLLSNKGLVSQIRTSSYILKSDLNTYYKNAIPGNQISFESLGYNGIELRGQFRQQASIGVKLPKNRQIGPGGRISLNMRYSKNLDFKKSLISIYVNGTPIGSKKLDQNNADKDTLELELPQNIVRNSSYLDVRVAFDLELEDTFCTFRQEEMPWAFILKDSYFYLPVNERVEFLFENYPSPFIRDGEWSDTALILPDTPSKEDLDMAAHIMAFMGRELQTNGGRFVADKAGSYSDNYKNMDLILIGTPENNKIIKQINDNLWFKYNSSFTDFLSNEKRQLIENYSNTLAAFQLIPSPLNKNCGAMVLTAPVSGNLYKASNFLYDSKLISRLYGDCTLIDTSGNVLNHYFRIYGTKTEETVKQVKAAPAQVKLFIIFFAGLLVFVLLILFFYVRRGKRYKH